MVKKRGQGRGFGGWAFLIGVILAVILGFTSSLTETWVWLLVIIGLVVGFLNVTDKEVEPFLIGGAVLIIASTFGGTVMAIVPRLNGILEAMLAIFVPATIIVAIKHVFSIAQR